jgi:hypothetical protein
MNKEELIQQMVDNMLPTTASISRNFRYGINAALSNPQLLAASGYVKTNGWVSVEDRLPAIGEDVLAYAEVKDITYYDFAAVEHNGFKMQHNKRVKITHWQPLPLKPKP